MNDIQPSPSITFSKELGKGGCMATSLSDWVKKKVSMNGDIKVTQGSEICPSLPVSVCRRLLDHEKKTEDPKDVNRDKPTTAICRIGVSNLTSFERTAY